MWRTRSEYTGPGGRPSDTHQTRRSWNKEQIRETLESGNFQLHVWPSFTPSITQNFRGTDQVKMSVTTQKVSSQLGPGTTWAHRGSMWCGSVTFRVKAKEVPRAVTRVRSRMTQDEVKSGVNLRTQVRRCTSPSSGNIKDQHKSPNSTYAMVISEELLCSRLKGRHCSTSNPNPWHVYPFIFMDITVRGSSPAFSTLKLFLMAKSGLLERRPEGEAATVRLGFFVFASKLS